jgi:putative heme iron utilization protein
MDVKARGELRDLITACRILTAAVEADGAPYAALLPYAVRPDFSGFLVHVSELAKHTRGLADGAAFALVIHRPDDGVVDPLQVPRVLLQGVVRRLERGTQAWAEAQAAYVARFPASEMTFGLGDFHLCELLPERGRLVTGFAGAHNIGPETLRRVAAESPE